MNLDGFRVRPGDRTAITRARPGHTGPFADRESAHEHLARGVARLEELQERLYAQDRHALVVILQGMDAAGKDSRVHPELLRTERLPAERITRDIWDERMEDINALERHLWRNGTTVRKFFLHVSRSAQRRRLLERIDDPAKNWKFSAADLVERRRWTPYQTTYAQALAATSTKHAPWYVIPADHKWFAHALIADIIVETLDSLDLSYPKLTPSERRELARVRRSLVRGE